MKEEIATLQSRMAEAGYIAERPITTALFLARSLQRPLLIEGEAGVGKTDVARVFAQIQQTELIRLQCYDGLDVHSALYEWNYPGRSSASVWRSGGDSIRIDPIAQTRSPRSRKRSSVATASWNVPF